MFAAAGKSSNVASARMDGDAGDAAVVGYDALEARYRLGLEGLVGTVEAQYGPAPADGDTETPSK